MAHSFLVLDRLLCGSCGSGMAVNFTGPALFEGAIPVKEQKFCFLVHCMNPQCEEYDKRYTAYLPRIELHEIPKSD